MLKLFLLLLVPASITSDLVGQSSYDDDFNTTERTIRLDYGLNIGAYFANRGTANYYNGSTPFHFNSPQTKLEYIFSNHYNQEIIREQIGNFPYNLPENPYPQNMHYSPTFKVGLFGAVYFSPSFGLIGDFNFARLRAQDNFVLEVVRNPVGLPEENMMLIPIWGIEERYDIRLGLQYTFLSDRNQINPYFEIGGNMTNTLVRENSIRIGDRTFPMHREQSDLYFQERDFGVGFGGFATVGAKLSVNQDYALWVGYSANLNRVNLGDNQQFLLNHSVFLRLGLAGVL